MPDEVDAGLEAASNAFTAALSGQAPSGAPAPAVEAAPPPAPAPSEPEPVATPAVPAAEPAPAAVSAPATTPAPISVQDPAAKRFLEMHGGDPEKALKAAMEYNNRLSALAKTHPEAFRAGGVADPTVPLPDVPFVPPTVPPEPIPVQPVELDPAQVRAETQAAVDQDAQATALIGKFAQNDTRLRTINTEARQIEGDLLYLQAKLKDPDFSADELKAADIKDKIRDARQELGILRQERIGLDAEQQQLDLRFQQRRQMAQDWVVSQLQSQANEQAMAQAVTQERNVSYQQLAAAWPSALDRAVQFHKIPADQVANFKKRAKVEAQARMGADSSFALDDVDSFVQPLAKTFVEEMDGYHRARSAQYALQAATRAATPAPTSAPAGVTTAVAADETDPDVLFERAAGTLRAGLRR